MTFFDPLIEAAKAGDDAAARGLVRYLAVCLERGEAPPAVLAAYFATAFRLIADGRSADRVLNTDGKSTFKRHYEIAQAVWKLNHRAVDPLPLKDNGKKTGAFATIGAEYDLSPARIKQIYDEMKKQVEAGFFEELPMTPEASRQRQVDLQIAFGQLAESLKKRVRN
ncbi:hypothetical protein [Pseudomonas sp. yb_5]|uniref:hypothetical protein n=1 Tax=Pseudomonas sp. yb_5 TaxID=3367220 RepID=UPI00370B757F